MTTSLLQFTGDIDRKRGVGLQFVKVMDHPDPEHPFTKIMVDTYVCKTCGRVHGKIGIAYRKPCKPMGHWVGFRYNGDYHWPDLSVPIDVEEYPKGTVVLSGEESSKLWHAE